MLEHFFRQGAQCPPRNRSSGSMAGKLVDVGLEPRVAYTGQGFELDTASKRTVEQQKRGACHDRRRVMRRTIRPGAFREARRH